MAQTGILWQKGRVEKNRKAHLLAGVYALVILLELLGECATQLAEWPWLVYATKPLMMPALAAFMLASLAGRVSRCHRFVLAGLFFSWLGDIFLMFTWTGGNYFLYGLSAFLVAHLMYINAFRMVERPAAAQLLAVKPWAALPLLVFVAGLTYTFYQYGNASFFDMQYPVLGYAAVILGMVLMALNRKDRVSASSYGMVFIGALLFMFSDSVIALNKFTPAFEEVPLLTRLFIMITYTGGQYLIAAGSLRQGPVQPG